MSLAKFSSFKPRSRAGRRSRVALVFMLMALSGGALAQAAEVGNSLEAKNKAAKTACLSGDYAKGVALLAEGYVETNNPMYLFNQGRCFQQNGRYEEAVLRFREYQRKNIDGGGTPDAEAEKQIADCLALLEVQKSREAEQRAAAAAATSGDGTPPFAGTPGGAAPAGAGAVAPGGAAGGAPAGSGGMSTQKKLGIAAVGIGALGVGIGVTAFFLGKSYLNTARDMGCTDQLCTGKAKDEYNKAQTAITISNIGGISGAVLLISGVVLILTSPSSTPASSVALVPVVGPGQAQLALTGTF